MKKKGLLLGLWLLCAILSSQAQGYMGKRFIFNMGASLSPAWIQPTAIFGEYENSAPWYAFNYTLSPNVECIVWKLGTAGICYHFFKTKYYAYYVYRSENSFLDFDVKEKIEDLNVQGLGIYYKQYFSSRSRAPMGTFLKFQIDDFFFKYPDGDNYQSLSTGTLLALKFEYGHDFLFFNRLRFSTGLSLGTTFGGYKELFFPELFFKTEASVLGDAKARILGHYWLGFTVGIGFLAF
ncbi:MAG: hypothetical protein LBH82_03455 [Bacteroidales bacterium]|jgi:hypothetical protein|nr:hypothetical protein [Bacteroidales bacterium]